MSFKTLEARELAFRSGDSIDVLLLWHPGENALTVLVEDARVGDCFEIAVAPDRALDAFYHPFAYAAEGIDDLERRNDHVSQQGR